MRPPREELETRHEAVRSQMRRRRLGALCLSDPASVRYVSGFTGSESALVLSRARAWLLTDFRYREEAEATADHFETVLWKGSLAGECGRRLRSTGTRRAGYEEAHLTVRDFEALRETAGRRELAGASSLVRRLRRRKSAWEVKRIAAALRIAEAAFAELRAYLRPGVREFELATELDYRMRRLGAEAPAFPTIVAFGANASLPHAHPGRRKLRAGGVVLIDWGARLHGYHSDLTRTLFAGSMSPAWRARYEAVRAAQRVGMETIAPSATGRDADGAARAELDGHGLAEAFGHALGHGVGLEVHEGPGLSRRNVELLEPGAVVTVEPGIYLPRRGGIRIEDMVLVTETGRRRLSRLPSDPDRAVV
jgi:Xaa-Pro aminopeptidase